MNHLRDGPTPVTFTKPLTFFARSKCFLKDKGEDLDERLSFHGNVYISIPSPFPCSTLSYSTRAKNSCRFSLLPVPPVFTFLIERAIKLLANLPNCHPLIDQNSLQISRTISNYLRKSSSEPLKRCS